MTQDRDYVYTNKSKSMISHHLIKHEPTIHLILKVNIIDTRP